MAYYFVTKKRLTCGWRWDAFPLRNCWQRVSIFGGNSFPVFDHVKFGSCIGAEKVGKSWFFQLFTAPIRDPKFHVVENRKRISIKNHLSLSSIHHNGKCWIFVMKSRFKTVFRYEIISTRFKTVFRYEIKRQIHENVWWSHFHGLNIVRMFASSKTEKSII